MRVLFSPWGSRGDVEPFVAIAEKLAAKGHFVEFVIDPSQTSSVPAFPGVRTHDIRPPNIAAEDVLVNVKLFALRSIFKTNELLPYFCPTSMWERLLTQKTLLKLYERNWIKDLEALLWASIFPYAWEVFLEVGASCDLIVTSGKLEPVASLVAEKLNIPYCVIHLQPQIPTDLYPHFSHSDDCRRALVPGKALIPKAEYLETWAEESRLRYKYSHDKCKKFHDERGLPVPTLEEVVSISRYSPNYRAVNAFDSELIPEIPDISEYVYQFGALADNYIPSDFDPPTGELVEFLKHRPICVGFGSMEFYGLTYLLEALEEVGRKAILVGGALKLPKKTNTWVSANVRHVSSIPYGWLFPQCEMMICHGGAGVTHAAVRAGIPIAIAPLLYDQFFFANLVEAKGLGVRVGPWLPVVSKWDFVSAIERATECIPHAKIVGERMRAKKAGVDRMVDLLVEMVNGE